MPTDRFQGRGVSLRYAKRQTRAQAERELKREATLEQARQIYREYEDGVPARVLAQRYGVGLSTVYRRIDDWRWQTRRYSLAGPPVSL